MWVWHSGDMPRSTKVVRRFAAQRRQRQLWPSGEDAPAEPTRDEGSMLGLLGMCFTPGHRLWDSLEHFDEPRDGAGISRAAGMDSMMSCLPGTSSPSDKG